VIIAETAYARSGLVGNPSDIFHGKTISFLFDAFSAEVVLYETPRLQVVPNHRDISQFEDLDEMHQYRKRYGYYGGVRIIEAMIVRLKDYCDQAGIRLPRRNFTIEYSSSVPFGLGLGGSSTIIKAVLSALMRFYELGDKDVPKPVQPNLILEAETEELGISAGPQDRVVAVYGGLVYMDFTEAAYAANNGVHGEYQKLDPSLLPPLFIAYKDELSKSSGTIHNIMRYRATVEHDARVTDAMTRKAALVDEALAALESGRSTDLGPILSRDFDLRRSVYDLTPESIRMIQIARDTGAHAKFTGSGGAAVGVFEDDQHYARLEEAYNRAGYRLIRAHVADYEDDRR
jgi:glucuronokinase